MTPDIEAYAEVIEAVFGQSSGRPPIPYSVADRKPRGAHEVALALFALLDALAGPALREQRARPAQPRRDPPALRHRHASELELIRAWVEESGVRWGVDAEHRAEVGQPALNENTWRFGLDRMLLGYAMPGRGKHAGTQACCRTTRSRATPPSCSASSRSCASALFTYRKALLDAASAAPS